MITVRLANNKLVSIPATFKVRKAEGSYAVLERFELLEDVSFLSPSAWGATPEKPVKVTWKAGAKIEASLFEVVEP